MPMAVLASSVPGSLIKPRPGIYFYKTTWESPVVYIHQGAVAKLLAHHRPQESNEWKDFIWPHHHYCLD